MNTLVSNAIIEHPHKKGKPDILAILQSMEKDNFPLYKDLGLNRKNYTGIKEMGLFYTPDKIAELIATIGQSYNPKSVIDICCGTGNILNSFHDIKTVKGIDIYEQVIRLAQYINPENDYIAADTLIYDFGNIKYDLVVGNLPFGAKTFDKSSLEIELIKKGLTLLNDNGVAIFIVPDGLLANSWSAEFRRQLLTNFALDMVISLPNNIFPTMSIKTSVLIIRNGKKNQDVFFPEFKDNGIEILDNFNNHRGDFFLPISKITNRLDRHFYLSQEAIDKILKGHQLIKLSDVSDIIRGINLDKNTFTTSGKYLVFNRRNKDGNNFINNILEDKYILKPDDIVVSRLGKNSNEIYLHKDSGIRTIVPSSYVIIRPRVEYKEYISNYLQTEDWKTLLQHYTKGSVFPHLTIYDLSNIEIPILPLSELKESFNKTITTSKEIQQYLLKSSQSVKEKDYNLARVYIDEAFKNADEEENRHRDTYLENIQYQEELELKDKALRLEIKEKEAAHKALQEKEKEMLSFFTHTMRNALATAPQSLRKTIHLLGSDDYEKNQNHYEAINNITSLFSTLSLMDCLIETFKQSINDPQEFKIAWQNDSSGEATPKWVIAFALRQSLHRIIFMSDTTELKKLINNQTQLIKSTRKTFLEKVLQLDLDNEGVNSFYDWLPSIPTINVFIEESNLRFGVSKTKFSLLFAITSELILNALKYWSGEGQIQIRWCIEQGYYIFTVKNACQRNMRSNLEGTHKGLAFVKRLMELLGGQASFTPTAEDKLFIAELKLHKTLLGDNG